MDASIMVIIFVGLFYLALFVGAIALLIWAISSRVKEKKIEKEKHKKYKDY